MNRGASTQRLGECLGHGVTVPPGVGVELTAMAATAPDRMLLVDGEWVETGDWVEVASPFDGSPVARVAKAGAAEAHAAVDAAERAMRDPLPAHKRAEILVRVADSGL